MKTVEKSIDKIIVKFDGADFKSALSVCKAKRMRWEPTSKTWWSANLSLYDELTSIGFIDPHTPATVDIPFTPTTVSTVDYKSIVLKPQFLPKEIRPYQIDAVRFMLSNDRNILGLPPGAGKTLCGAVYANHIEHDKPYTVIICPASLKTMWARELAKWGGIDATILDGMAPHPIRPIDDVLILNYDILGERDPVEARKYKKAVALAKENNMPAPRDNVPLVGWANELMGKVGLIIVDESHMLGDTSSIRVRMFIKLAKGVRFVQFLSGTPIRNKPVSFFTQLQTCDATTFSSQMHYMRRYCKPRAGFRGRIVYDGSSNMAELHDKIKKFTYYRSKEDILPDLPKKNFIMKMIDGNKDFDKQNQEIQQLLDKGETLKIEELSKIKDLIRSAYYLKRQTIFEMVDDLVEDGEKVVLVAYHKAVIADLVDRYKCTYISGEVPSSKRQGIIDKFESGRKKVIVLQLQSGGVGFSILTSRTMVLAESWYVHAEVDQVLNRIHRLTSTWDQVDYHFPVVTNSVEEEMMSAISLRSSDASVILTGRVRSLLDSPATLDTP